MNRKSILLLLLALCLTFGLCACAGGDTTATTVPDNQTGETTEPNETTGPSYTGPVYNVTVQDEQGNPIAGAMVQLCQGTDCRPKATDTQGVARYEVEQADYEVKLVRLPTGYTYATSQDVFTFENGSNELTIVLKKTA